MSRISSSSSYVGRQTGGTAVASLLLTGEGAGQGIKSKSAIYYRLVAKWKVIDPSSLAISPDGRLYISSKWGNNICWVDPKTNDAAAVLCGSGAPESKDGDFSHCSFNAPSAICFLSDGKMLVAESGALRMVDLASRQVTTFCDHIPIPFECDAARQQIIALEEDWDGGILALFDEFLLRIDRHAKTSSLVVGHPSRSVEAGQLQKTKLWASDFAVRPEGDLVVTGPDQNGLYVIDEDADTITPLAGDGKRGYGDGPAHKVSLCRPYAVCCDTANRIFFAERDSGHIKLLDQDGMVTNIHPGRFVSIKSITIDWLGQIWAIDNAVSRLVCFAPPLDGSASASPGLTLARLRSPSVFMIKSTSMSFGSLLTSFSDLADIDIDFGEITKRLHSCIIRARAPRFAKKASVAHKLKEATYLSASGVELAIKYLYCDELPGASFMSAASMDFLEIARQAMDAMVILQILGLRAASKACRAIAQKAISKITDHNELVLVIKMVLQSDSYELLESLKAALMKSQSSKVKNHLKKLREEGIDAFDDVMDAMKSKTSLLSFDSPRPSFEDVVIKARPFISSMSADFLHELEDSIAYDYTLRLAAGQNIQVHKAILAARWPYFGALVNSNMAESRKAELSFGVSGEDPNGLSYSALLSLVKFFYTGSTKYLHDVDDCVQILATADYFQLYASDPEFGPMLVHCFTCISCSVSPASWKRLLLATHKFGIDDIKEKIMEWVAKNLGSQDLPEDDIQDLPTVVRRAIEKIHYKHKQSMRAIGK